MKIENLIKQKLIIFIKSEKKKEAIKELLNVVEENILVKDIKVLENKVLHREGLMSTGIGLGIAIPHARIDEVDSPIIVIGVQKNGIKDYESIDNIPVKILILVVCKENQHSVHIKLLSQIVSKLKKDNNIDKIVKAKDIEEIYKIFTR